MCAWTDNHKPVPVAAVTMWRQWKAVATVVTIAFSMVPYLNCLHGEFVYDDKVAVMANPDVINHALPFSGLLFHDFWGNSMRISWPWWLGGSSNTTASAWTHSSYRPITVMTFRLNHATTGLTTWSYHVGNMVVHAAACVGALFTALHIVGTSRWVQACIAAWLFALHPLHTEVVTNVTGRCETLCGVFVFASLATYMATVGTSGHRPPSRVASSAAVFTVALGSVLATMCKETGLVLPLTAACLDLICCTRETPPSNTSRRRPTSTAGAVAAYVRHLLHNANWPRVVALLVYQVVLLYMRVVVLSSGYQLNTSTMHNPLAHLPTAAHRRLSFAYVQTLAMSMLVLPVYLSHEHNALTPVTSWTDPRLVLTLVVYACIVGLVVSCFHPASGDDRVSDLARLGVPHNGAPTAHRRRARILSALAIIAVAYVPASHLLVHVAFVLAERSLFLPSFGASLLVVEAVSWAASLLPGGHAVPPSPVAVPPPAPSSSPPHVEAATAVPATAAPPSGLRHRRPGGGERVRPPALQVPPLVDVDDGVAGTPPGFWVAAVTVMVFAGYFCARTMVRNLDWLDEPRLLRSNLALYPDNNPMSLYGLGAKAFYRQELDEAYDLLQRSIKAAPVNATFAEPHILLAQLHWAHQYGGANSMELAKQHLERLVDMRSAKREFFTNLGLLNYASAPHDVEVVKRAEYLILLAAEAPAIGPNDPNRGLLYNNAGCFRILSPPERYGHGELAQKLFDKAVQYAHPQAERNAHANMAMYFAINGYFDDAVQRLEAAVLSTARHTDTGVSGDLERYEAFAAKLASHEAIVRSWLGSTPIPVTGPAAQQRMDVLDANCKTLLIWL